MINMTFLSKNYQIYSLRIGLFAWATTERHIPILHDQWVSTQMNCFFIHYLPMIITIIYYSTSFDGFLIGSIYVPCTFNKIFLEIWNFIARQIIPT